MVDAPAAVTETDVMTVFHRNETKEPLPVRLRGGVPPYTWLLNGAPAAIATRDPVAQLPGGPGMSELSVTDATGTTRRARLRMIPP